ncbi:hypothetical protein CTI12_AA586380 [Artemisia annua]|uniref:Pentatricopeptide repeat-containing protein n=1 Tax=Artemisia annua TaxID=35608 RepID=A0A2U1KMA4_ARTAN|nr:hypothetical protein CTI12_AA586380 [Artemisia annua]
MLSSFICLLSSFHAAHSFRRNFSSSLGPRHFPDYSPKKPTIKDSQLVHNICTTIKQRPFDPIQRVLKPFESRFKSDHFIWVLMDIKDHYSLVLNFFHWLCLRRSPSLEARCIVIQISVAAKDPKMAHGLIHDFWTKPNVDASLPFTLFMEKLIYTYKDWGSNPHVFDIFFQYKTTIFVPTRYPHYYHCQHMLSSFICLLSSFHAAHSFRRNFSSSLGPRHFPDYSPKKPTIKDSQLVHNICTTIKQRPFDPIQRVLKPFESRFKSDHFIWVLMDIKDHYSLVLNFFHWLCLRRSPSLEARCIVIQISVAAKDPKMAHGLIHDFWTKPNVDASLPFTLFMEKLIYTYKDWGSNPHVFDIFFQVLVQVGILDGAKKLFYKMLNYGVVISVDSCNMYLSQLSKNIDGCKTTPHVFSEFSEEGVRWNTMSHNIMIHALCRMGKVKEAHNLLLQMELRGYMCDTVSYSTMINGYCQIGEHNVVLKLMDEMQIKGLKPNMFTLNSVIFLLCKIGKVVDAEKVLREMIYQKIVPDKVVYTTLIDGFCKAGNITAAYRLFEEMRRKNIFPDPVTYTALISGNCQKGNISEAYSLFLEMRNREMEVDEVTYTVLIDGYCKDGQIKEAFSLHNQMVRMGLTPNIVTYTALVDGLCKQGEMDTANELLLEICAKGLKLNICTYNSLVNGLCKLGNIVQATKLVEDMEVAGIYPDTYTYTTLMDAYCKAGDMDKAHELLRRMLDKGLQPTVVTFNVLMNGFCMAGMLEDGKRLLKWMLEKGIMPNATTYNSLMKQYSIRNDMHATTEIYRGLLGEGLSPNANTYDILIRGHCKARNMKEAWFLHKEMVEKGYDLSVNAYNALIKGFIKRKRIQEAKTLFDEMRKKGLAADRELYSIFMDMNYHEGNLDLTLELCDEALEKSIVDKTGK